MKLSWQPDPEGEKARKYSKEQRLQGIIPLSCTHELLFANVSKTVVTRTVSGMVVDYRENGLFEVLWANGDKDNLVSTSFLRRSHLIDQPLRTLRSFRFAR